MAKTPRDYPETMASPESGRPMARGEKLVTLKVDSQTFEYRQPGWWCSLDDPDDLDGQLVDEDNSVAEMARLSAHAIAKGEAFPRVPTAGNLLFPTPKGNRLPARRGSS